MKNIVVLYKSKYGSTKRYAQWIAEELDVPLLEASKVTPAELKTYDLIIYGGGLYARSINGVKLVTRNPCKALVVFTVGLSNPATTNYTEVLSSTFTPDLLDKIPIFHFHGGIFYGKLTKIHKGMMTMVKKHLEKQPAENRTAEDNNLIEAYGKDVDFSDRASITPLIQYVRARQAEST